MRYEGFTLQPQETGCRLEFAVRLLSDEDGPGLRVHGNPPISVYMESGVLHCSSYAPEGMEEKAYREILVDAEKRLRNTTLYACMEPQKLLWTLHGDDYPYSILLQA